MSKLDRIHTFVTVIEQNSFVNAAKKLKTAPATITRQISALEAELGIQLIARTTRRLKLTEMGELYFIEAQKLIEQFKHTENLIAQSHIEPSGKLSVTAHRYFAKTMLTPHLAGFLARYPKITLHLQLAELAPQFNSIDSDIIFGTLGDGPSDTVRRRIASGQFILCAAPAYLKQFGTPLKPIELNQHRFITHTIRQPADILNFNHHPPLRVQPILWLDDSETMVQAALDGLGIIKVLDFRVSEALAAGTLVSILDEFSETEHPVYLYYRRQRYIDAKIRAFIDYFLSKLPPEPR